MLSVILIWYVLGAFSSPIAKVQFLNKSDEPVMVDLSARPENVVIQESPRGLVVIDPF